MDEVVLGNIPVGSREIREAMIDCHGFEKSLSEVRGETKSVQGAECSLKSFALHEVVSGECWDDTRLLVLGRHDFVDEYRECRTWVKFQEDPLVVFFRGFGSASSFEDGIVKPHFVAKRVEPVVGVELLIVAALWEISRDDWDGWGKWVDVPERFLHQVADSVQKCRVCWLIHWKPLAPHFSVHLCKEFVHCFGFTGNVAHVGGVVSSKTHIWVISQLVLECFDVKLDSSHVSLSVQRLLGTRASKDNTASILKREDSRAESSSRLTNRVTDNGFGDDAGCLHCEEEGSLESEVDRLADFALVDERFFGSFVHLLDDVQFWIHFCKDLCTSNDGLTVDSVGLEERTSHSKPMRSLSTEDDDEVTFLLREGACEHVVVCFAFNEISELDNCFGLVFRDAGKSVLSVVGTVASESVGYVSERSAGVTSEILSELLGLFFEGFIALGGDENQF
ncbi:hypothetical protein BLNAU_8745 [Blattamonas nauphoetae]|uniref:Uncharacterized protein n=1 Tax=Blattamonas nauphoetae TaxID=2049346 RepID=A0ABQ9XXJ0_9EUKA|nr:hypothetical protein BLNAU_8745 [Blattamonas nauphoetae]